MTGEPEDGSYVAVHARDGYGNATQVYRRRDDWAATHHLGESHWFSRTNPQDAPLTWTGVCRLGPVTYVGAFVDRQAGATA